VIVAAGAVIQTLVGLALVLAVAPLVGFRPDANESMPAALRWFAEHQPFTPLIETVRGLLTGTVIGSSGLVATAWCAGMALVGYLWARRNYERRPAR
jgi:ABC-2 type transport system permease protein